MNLAMLLDIPASIVPDAPALLGPSVETFGELRDAAGRTASLLESLGVGPGDRVGLFATNSPEYIEAMFGVSILGAVAVPMNYRARGPELAHLLADSGTKALFAESRYEDLVRESAPAGLPVIYLDRDFSERKAAAENMELVADVDDDDVGIILYTSGTTSLPKGVMLSHGSLSGYVINRTECADGTDRGRSLLSAPLHHIAAVSSVLSSLYGGRPVVLMPQFDAAGWLEEVERHRVTHAFLVPTMLARIVALPDVTKRDITSLELVTYGAAPMPPSVIRRAIEVFPSSVGFTGAYGQTETTSTVTVLDPDDHRMEGTPEEIERKQRRLASVGKAVGDVELRVIDEDGQPAEPGVVGEVQIRTFRTMSGYWGSNAGATAKTVESDGWLHTGDLGYLDEDGYLFLGGRQGGLIIRGGENISPEDVEAAVYEHPDVAEAGVVGVPDEEWGERVAVAVVPRAGAELTTDALLEFCSARLPGYKRPEIVLIVDSLPRTSTGKLLRRELLPMFASRT